VVVFRAEVEPAVIERQAADDGVTRLEDPPASAVLAAERVDVAVVGTDVDAVVVNLRRAVDAFEIACLRLRRAATDDLVLRREEP
jgi:hypothetical protein